MNIKPPNKNDDTHRKYKYLIWRDGVGFMHLENFSKEELESFAASLSKEYSSRESKLSSKREEKSLTINDK